MNGLHSYSTCGSHEHAIATCIECCCTAQLSAGRCCSAHEAPCTRQVYAPCVLCACASALMRAQTLWETGARARCIQLMWLQTHGYLRATCIECCTAGHAPGTHSQALQHPEGPPPGRQDTHLVDSVLVLQLHCVRSPLRDRRQGLATARAIALIG